MNGFSSHLEKIISHLLHPGKEPLLHEKKIFYEAGESTGKLIRLANGYYDFISLISVYDAFQSKYGKSFELFFDANEKNRGQKIRTLGKVAADLRHILAGAIWFKYFASPLDRRLDDSPAIKEILSTEDVSKKLDLVFNNLGLSHKTALSTGYKGGIKEVREKVERWYNRLYKPLSKVSAGKVEMGLEDMNRYKELIEDKLIRSYYEEIISGK